jgi:hypothetical protein
MCTGNLRFPPWNSSYPSVGKVFNMRSMASRSFTNLSEWLHQLWNRLHILQPLWDCVAGSRDPIKSTPGFVTDEWPGPTL